MKLDRELGCYFPAFFMMHIDVDRAIADVFNSNYERILSHELIHFLQDVSTTYGLINISACVDVIKDQNKIMRNASGGLEIPISSIQYSETVMANKDLFSIYWGDSAEKYKKFSLETSITSLTKECEFVDYIQKNVVYIEIEYGSDPGVSPSKFHFGSMALYESMAHLIENEIYDETKLFKSFPYDSALMVAEYIFPSIKNNKLAVAELCEAALMYYNPGEIFVAALELLSKNNPDLINPNDFYSYVLNNFTFEAISVEDEYLRIVNSTKEQLDDLFTVPPFSQEKWGSKIVESAKNIRMENLSLSSRLWGNDKILLRETLMSLVKGVGFPVTSNKNFDIWIQDVGHELNTPLMFPAILSIHEILHGRRLDCYLYKHCSNNSEYNSGEDCKKNPWSRAKEGKSCHFSNIWKMWGLEDVQIISLK